MPCPPAQTAATRGHLEELRSLLTQSSWEVVSPFPITLHVLRFFLRCVVPSPSDPDSHCTREEKSRTLTRCNPFCRSTGLRPQDTARMSELSQRRRGPTAQPWRRVRLPKPGNCTQTPGARPALPTGGLFRIKTYSEDILQSAQTQTLRGKARARGPARSRSSVPRGTPKR